MTYNFYKRHNSDFFKGKEAVVVKTLRNKAQETIPEGSVVIISHKSGRGGFYIQQGHVHINRVSPESLDLVEKTQQ